MDLSGLIEAISNGIARLPSSVIAAILLGGPTAIWIITRFVNPPDVRKPEELPPEDRLWLCASCLSINEDRLESCYRCHRVRAPESVPVVIDGGAPRVGVAAASRQAGDSVPGGWLGGEFALPAALAAVGGSPAPPPSGMAVPPSARPALRTGKATPSPGRGPLPDTAPSIGRAAPPGKAASPGKAAPPSDAPVRPARAAKRASAKKGSPPPEPATIEGAASIQEPSAEADSEPTPEDAPVAEPVILEPRVKVSGRAPASGPPRRRRKPQGAGEANSKRN